MQLRFLGTSAAEGWPAVFCSCRACREARLAGGKNIRTRASLLLDGEILVDFPPDLYHHFLTYGLEYRKLKYLLVTHGHRDHFSPAELKWRKPPFIDTEGCETLTIAGNWYVMDCLREMLEEPGEYKIITRELEAYHREELGRFTVWPLPANHAPEKGAFLYLLAGGGKRIFIAYDTGWFLEPVWEWLAENAEPPLDCVVMECTAGPGEGGEEHMGFTEVLKTRDRLAKIGLLRPETLCLTTHFSHTGGLLQSQLEEFFAPEGIAVAYDGMEVTV